MPLLALRREPKNLRLYLVLVAAAFLALAAGVLGSLAIAGGR